MRTRRRSDSSQCASASWCSSGAALLCGRVRALRRPRSQLPSWAAFASEDRLHERAVEQMLIGATRRTGEAAGQALAS
jgi:hypothetical protein